MMSDTGLYSSSIDCTITAPEADLSGKTAVVTGGSNGIGAQYVRRLVKAGANVCIGDIDEAGARSLQKELGDKVSFSKCSVTEWTEQVALFTTALKHTGRIDIVVANAGITSPDDIHLDEPDNEIPNKPRLRTLDINVTGVMYTTKLALHHFKRQYRGTTKGNKPSPDSVLILQVSVAGYLGIPNTGQYTASKFAVRGLFRALRPTSRTHGTRVNCIAPWFVRTALLSDPMVALLESKVAEAAEVEDVAEGMFRLVSGDAHGRTLTIVPRSMSPATGYLDLDGDDWPKDSQLQKMQQIADKLFLGKAA